MDKNKLDYFRNLLLEQRTRALDAFRDDRASSQQEPDGAIDVVEAAELEREESVSLNLVGRESDLVKEIDAALQRIEDGTYGQCERCGRPIDEDRLKAVPTARYDAACQSQIETAQGVQTPSL